MLFHKKKTYYKDKINMFRIAISLQITLEVTHLFYIYLNSPDQNNLYLNSH